MRLTEDTAESPNLEFERIDENEREARKGNKRLFVRRIEGIDLWVVEADGKQTLPVQLQGMFTSPVIAYEAIGNYWK